MVRVHLLPPVLLVYGVMVTQQTLTLSFQVRALVGLPTICSYSLMVERLLGMELM